MAAHLAACSGDGEDPLSQADGAFDGEPPRADRGSDTTVPRSDTAIDTRTPPNDVEVRADVVSDGPVDSTTAPDASTEDGRLGADVGDVVDGAYDSLRSDTAADVAVDARGDTSRDTSTPRDAPPDVARDAVVSDSRADADARDADAGDCSLPVVPTPGRQTLRMRGTTCARLGYAEYVPPGYATATKMPLLVAFHGDGQRGNGTSDLALIDNDGLPAQIAADDWDPQHRFIVLAPQMTSDQRTAVNVRDFLAFALSTYKVDLQRVYLTGLSGGGGALYRYLEAYGGGRIAAFVAISAVYTFDQRTCMWSDVPAWFFHGASDTTVTPGNSNVPFTDVQTCTPAPVVAPRFTEYTGIGHNAWTRTYDLSGMGTAVQSGRTPYTVSIYDWLLQYSRP